MDLGVFDTENLKFIKSSEDMEGLEMTEDNKTLIESILNPNLNEND